MGIQVLGAIEVNRAETAVPLGGPRQRRLLAALVSDRERMVSVDRLTDILWTEGSEPERVHRTIGTYVSRLRATLDAADLAGALQKHDGGYRLYLDDSSVDARRFEELADRSRDALDRDDAAAALGDAARAFDLWRGRPYDEFADEPWIQPEVMRLEERHVGLEEIAIEARLALGEHTRVIAEVEVLRSRHPLRERLVALLMLAQYRSGRQTEALESYQAHRRILADELGLDVGPDLADLERRILVHDPTLVAPEPDTRLLSYQLGPKVGESARGAVHRAIQPAVGRELAIRIIPPELAGEPDFIRRFEVQAQRAARVEHPHVVPLLDYWRDPAGAYLVTPWMSGGSLEDRLRSTPPLDPESIHRLVLQVGGALVSAHRSGVLHGDIRPANILFDDSDHAYLTDFGLTMPAITIEPSRYVAPEMVGNSHATVAADIFGLGASIDALMGGAGAVPPAVHDVVTRATAERFEERFAEAAEMLDAFEAAWTGKVAFSAAADIPNPYMGLRPFTEADSENYFGHDDLIGEIIDRIGGPEGRLVTVVGPSGAGKSSLVNAGVLPRLRAGAVAGSDRWYIVTITPGAHPFEELEAALLRLGTRETSGLLDELQWAERGIARAVKRMLPSRAGELLLVIDQFEELFTLTAETERAAFLSGLAQAIEEPGGRLRVLSTLRADFYDRPLADAELGRLVARSVVNVPPLSETELALAITGPAERVGCPIEPGLVEDIVADVHGDSSALPLVQYAMSELFDQRTEAGMTRAVHRSIGGVTGALVTRAEQVYGDLGPREQAAARTVLTRLAALGEGSQDTRRRVRREELTSIPRISDVADHVIDAFGRSRLLSFDRDAQTRQPVVELAHDSLLSSWPRLRSWLDDDRTNLRLERQISTAATAWSESGREPGDLLRGARLASAAEWDDGHSDQLTPLEQGFVSASRAAERAETERERTQQRRLRVALISVASLLVIALIGTVLAVRSRNQAAAARDEADFERLLGDVENTLTDDQTLALLLAVEAARTGDRAAGIDALQTALTSFDNFLGAMGSSGYSDVEWSRTGDRIYGVTGDVVEVRDPSTGEVMSLISGFDGQPRQIARQPGGDLAVVTTEGSAAAVVDMANSEIIGVLPQTHPSTRAAFDPEGELVAVGHERGSVTLWRIDPLVAVRTWQATPGDVSDVGFDPAGQILLTGSRSGDLSPLSELSGPDAPLLRSVHQWSVGQILDPTAEVLALNEFYSVRGQDVQALEVAPSSRNVIIVTGGLARMIDLDARFGTLDMRLKPTGQGAVTFVDGDTIAIAEGPGLITLTGVDGTQLATWDTRQGSITGLAVSPDGATMAASHSNGPLTTWSLDGRRLTAERLDIPAGLRIDVDGESNTMVVWRPSATDDSLSFWDVGTYKLKEDVTERIKFEAFISEAALAREGMVLTIVASVLRVWDADDDGNMGTVNLSVEPFEVIDYQYLGWSPISALIANSGFGNESIAVWSYETDSLVAELSGDATAPCRGWRTMVFSPDGTRLSGVDCNNRATEWSVDDWSPTTLPFEGVGAVNYSNSGEQRILSFVDGTMEIQDIATGASVTRLLGHTSLVESVSTDGVTVLSSSEDGTVRRWDYETGQQLGRPIPNDALTFVAGTLDTLVTSEGDHLIRWDLDDSKWIELACRAAGRNMTRAEWADFGLRSRGYHATCPQWPTEVLG